jgi:LacI family transcriptional regulator
MQEPSIRLYADVVHAYGRGILRGISDYTKTKAGWDVQFANLPPSSFTHALVQDSVQGIVINLRTREHAQELIASGIRAVNTSNMLDPAATVPAVFVDDEAVGRLAAEYFLERGFRNFAFVGVQGHRFSRQRLEGFSSVLAQSGFSVVSLPGGATSADNLSIPTFSAQRDARSKFLAELPHPLAVFCANDICGKETIRDAMNVGLRVPDQVAVLGVDNDEIYCELSGVQLSSIRVNGEAVGYAAAELLARILAGENIPSEPILIPPIEVITRRSTDILAIEDSEVAAVVRFIRDRGGRDINVEDLLSRTHLSRRSLEMRFRKALGRSPYQEIRRVQMERAKVMLSRTDLPLHDITAAVHAGKKQSLGVALGDRIGLAPRQYRRRNREKKDVSQIASLPLQEITGTSAMQSE